VGASGARKPTRQATLGHGGSAPSRALLGARIVGFGDGRLEHDEKGIAAGSVAWFKDPDGNTLAIQQ
jgi:hypothetical protein